MARRTAAARGNSGGRGPDGKAAARASKVTKVYGSGDTAVTALRGIDLTFPYGRFTAIMGPSGSGKSTLMHCLAGLDRISSGRVFIGDVDLSRLNDKQLTRLRRDRIGFVFQQFNLLPTLTAEENITLPLDIAGRKPDKKWMKMVIDAVGLSSRLNHRPPELSGGQQQRVACARALVTRPDIIFADEPTGNLDSRSGAEVLGFLRDSVTELGQTIVMVTHDPTAASYSDEVIFLADGRLVDAMAEPTADAVLDRMKTLDSEGHETTGRRGGRRGGGRPDGRVGDRGGRAGDRGGRAGDARHGTAVPAGAGPQRKPIDEPRDPGYRDGGYQGGGYGEPAAGPYTRGYEPDEGYPAGPPTDGYPVGPATGGYPTSPETGGYPTGPATGGYPAGPATGGYPVGPSTGGYPVDPGTGGYPVGPATGGYPTGPTGPTGQRPADPFVVNHDAPGRYPAGPDVTGPYPMSRYPSGQDPASPDPTGNEPPGPDFTGPYPTGSPYSSDPYSANGRPGGQNPAGWV